MPAVGEVCVAAYEDGWYIGKVSLVRSAESREAQVELMKEISQKQFVWDEPVTHTHTTTVHANFILSALGQGWILFFELMKHILRGQYSDTTHFSHTLLA